MTAIEETRADGGGKDIRGGSQPTTDGVHPALPWPHLPYGDAVHATLAEMAMLPDLLETGMRQEFPDFTRELFLRLDWLPGHDDLAPAAVHEDGLTFEWSHLAGWSARTGEELVALDVDEIADPCLIAEAAMHAALCGLGCACLKAPDQHARWEFALELDIALVAFDEREVTQ